MKNMNKALAFGMVLVLLVALLGLSFSRPVQPMKPAYVASTSWVAAIAELAGIDDVATIAPANLKHPPEYEITPEDIVKVSQAELFMQAGYEAMMKTIANAAEVDKEKVVKVKTTNSLENLENMVQMLSEKAGTKEKADKRFGEYKKLIEWGRAQVAEKGLDKLTVWVHKDQIPLATDLGLNVVGTFGSAPLTSEQLALAAEKKFDIIIDNLHNSIADPAKSVSPNSAVIVWRNFPDHTGDSALYNIVKNNIETLLAL